jgi:hypothetical protein
LPDQNFDNATKSIVQAIQGLTDNVATISQQLTGITQGEGLWTPSTIISLALLFITVVGWVVAYIYGVRIQKKKFYLDVINNARKDLVSAITECQDWLSQIDIIAIGIEQNLPFISISESTLRDWYIRLSAKEYDPLKCYYVSEEYKRIFPEAHSLIKDLHDMHYDNIVIFNLSVQYIMKPPTFIISEQFNEFKSHISNNIKSMQDILPRYIYNLQQIKVYINESVFIKIFGIRGKYQLKYDHVEISVSEDDKGKKFDVVFKDRS